MALANDGSTALKRTLSTWYSNMQDLPYSRSSYYMEGLLAPWFGYYTNMYCVNDATYDCEVRTRMIPFEGKGTDLAADITKPTTWGLIDSPIRINPSSARIPFNW